jgi:hypothetical protein
MMNKTAAACVIAIMAALTGEAIGQGMLLGVERDRSAAPAWTPASLTAPFSWYDPSDMATMWQDSARTTPVTAAGQSVCALDDKSGAGNHVTQATTGNCPVLTLDAGSRPYLACGGTKSLVGGVTAIIQNTGLFFVSSASQATGAGGMIWAIQTPAGNEMTEFSYSSNGSGYEFSGRRLNTDGFTTSSVGSADTAIQSVIGVHDYSGATTTIYKNGTAVFGPTAAQTAGLTANSTSSTFSICSWTNGGYNVNANIYQVVVGQVLSAGDRASLDTFLRSKVGL